MSGDRDTRDGDEELEALLRGLVPNPLDVGFIAGLNRDREQVLSERGHNPSRMQWSRVIPLTLVCTVVMFLYALYRFGDRLGHPPLAADRPATAAATLAGAPSEEAAPGTDPSAITQPDPRFVPVSSHGTILKTSSGGLIETEEGPRQRLNIEYRDAYHWHDPESGTNIRFFRPRNEEVIVPLPAN
jgi:hypothetical protein